MTKDGGKSGGRKPPRLSSNVGGAQGPQGGPPEDPVGLIIQSIRNLSVDQLESLVHRLPHEIPHVNFSQFWGPPVVQPQGFPPGPPQGAPGTASGLTRRTNVRKARKALNDLISVGTRRSDPLYKRAYERLESYHKLYDIGPILFSSRGYAVGEIVEAPQGASSIPSSSTDTRVGEEFYGGDGPVRSGSPSYSPQSPKQGTSSSQEE